jgi:pimeloyl-ACP methyl ester carboxylesterase
MVRPERAVLAALAAWALQHRADAAPADALYTRPGQIVPAGDGARLNLYCTGNGSPTVVFESGWEDWAPAWATVQSRIAQWTRACSYDRAGAGFSDPGPMPRTSVRIADELHTALHNAGIAGPYILVGHAFGGDCVRTFAERYLPEVAGLVMVEADAQDLEPEQMREEDRRGEARVIQRLRECRDAIALGKPLPPLPSRGQPPRNCAQQFFRGLPEPAWSAELNAKLLQIAQTKIAMYDAYLSEMEQMPKDEDYLREHRLSLGSRPIRVLTTGNHGVGHLPAAPETDPKRLDHQHQIAQAQARWLELSSNARQIFTQKHTLPGSTGSCTAPLIACRARRSGNTQRAPGPQRASSGETTTPTRTAMPGSRAIPAGGPTRWDRNRRTPSGSKTWPATSGNGRRIVMPKPTPARRRTAAQRSRGIPACASISAARGSILPGRSDQRRASGTPPPIGTS